MQRLLKITCSEILGVLLILPVVSWGQGVAQPSGSTVTQIQASEGQQEKERQQDAKRAQLPAQHYTEAQALDLAKTIQSIDKQAGQMAREKSQQRGVTSLAQQLEKNHDEVGRALENFEKKTKVSPQASATGDNLEKTWQSRLDHLKGLKKGAEFDKAFLDHEIKFHQESLQLLQTGLTKSAKNPELQRILGRIESDTKTNLQRAQYTKETLDNEAAQF